MASDRDDDLPPNDAPRRRRRDDDDEPVALGPLDKMFRDTNSILLIVFGVCCNWIAAIVGLIAMLTAKDPVAKKNGRLVLIIGAAMGLFWIVVNVVMSMMGGPR
jgi:uncharacterized membrane protein